MVLPLVLMLQGGGRALADIEVIAQDQALRKAANLKRVPASSTLGDWLRRAGASRRAMGGQSGVQEELTRTMLLHGTTTDFTLDIDTTIIEADKGDASRAYDGTVGYQPMLGFLFEKRWLLHEQFRRGSASPGSGIEEFLGACWARMPKGTRIARFRSDSAGYNHKVIDYCEAEGIEYVIGADWDSAVKAAYAAVPPGGWTRFIASSSRKEREVAETVHAFNKGQSSFRLIFVRDVERQLELFDAQPRGQALITNIAIEKMDAAAVVEWYNQRGTTENFIKELKHGVGMLHVPCGQFAANAAWFRIAGLAYNLFLMQQAFALPAALLNAQIGTVRWRFYQTAARLVRHARHVILKVATDAVTFGAMLRLRAVTRQFAFP